MQMDTKRKKSGIDSMLSYPYELPNNPNVLDIIRDAGTQSGIDLMIPQPQNPPILLMCWLVLL